MKILIINPWIRLGGAENVCWSISAQLQERGHSAQIATTFFDPAGLPNRAKEPEYLLPPARIADLCRRSRVFFLVVGPWLLLAQVWKHARDADVLNPHNFPAVWIAVAIGALKRIPVVWTCNEPPERLNWKTGLRVGVADFLGWWVASSWIDRVMIRKVENIHVLSDRARKEVLRRYSRSATVIPTPVDASFWSGGQNNRVRKAYGLDQKFVMLTVGKLHPQKNQLLSIQTLEAILPQVPSAVLVLVGDGPMIKHLKGEVAKRNLQQHVVFLSRVSNETLRGLYRASSVNLVGAINQSWGLTAFEALCAGTISIVSADAGASEVLLREGIGLVCQPTVEAFAEQVLRVYRDPEFRDEIVKRGKSYVAANLTWGNFVDSLLAFMEIAHSSHNRAWSPTAEGHGVSR